MTVGTNSLDLFLRHRTREQRDIVRTETSAVRAVASVNWKSRRSGVGRIGELIWWRRRRDFPRARLQQPDCVSIQTLAFHWCRIDPSIRRNCPCRIYVRFS